MRYLGHLIGLALVGLLSLLFMVSAHTRAREDAIDQLYSQEKILANQAANGISEYFIFYKQILNLLAANTHVIKNDSEGQGFLKSLFASQTNSILSMTRVGPDRKILYTYPEEKAIGQDVGGQAHIQALFDTHKPVVSGVFKAVQGFYCVALHVPVFDGARFDGSLAILFSFKEISRRYLEGIQVGQSGYAILLSQEGIELFCPVPGHVGNAVQDTSKDFKAVLDMADRMRKGKSGTALYTYDKVGPETRRNVRKRAFFMPIQLENTFWAICISAPEEEALAFIKGFSDRWSLALAILVGAFGVWGYFLVRAFVGMHRQAIDKAAQAKIDQAEKAKEMALRDSEVKFRSYFEHSLLAMAITSPGKGWVAVNDRLCALLDYSREELLSSTWAQLTHPDDLESDEKQFNRMIDGEIQGYSLEKRFVRKDKRIVDTILSVCLIRRSDGTPDYCLAQLQDITGRKLEEAERTKLGEQLRQSQKMEAIGQLAGGVAHDFNNLLTVQLGSISLLKEEPSLPAEWGEALSDIEESAERAAALTRQLLAFSRQQILRIKRVDMNEVLAGFYKMLRRIIREDITLEFKTADAPLWIDADSGMMEQVFMNLAVNARDAMPQGGRLSIHTDAIVIPEKPANPEARPGRFIRLTVADNGCGMTEDTLKHIFEPFFTTKEIGKGTGLGMATVYGIVKQHQGWIEVQSAVGRGSTFHIYYPAAPNPVPQDKQNGGSAAPRGSGQTILLVEDDPAVRLVTNRVLTRLGYRLLEAANSGEALEAWRSHRSQITLLISDMVMPNSASGLDIARQIRAQCPDLPVILMSGHSFDLAEGGIPEDMVFLSKPCVSSTLASAVWKCVQTKVA
jgi:PAS domain S-box-containing protein